MWNDTIIIIKYEPASDVQIPTLLMGKLLSHDNTSRCHRNGDNNCHGTRIANSANIIKAIICATLYIRIAFRCIRSPASYTNFTRWIFANKLENVTTNPIPGTRIILVRKTSKKKGSTFVQTQVLTLPYPNYEHIKHTV
jgi:hypothetical protein